MKVGEAVKILSACDDDMDLHIVWLDGETEVFNEVDSIISDDVDSVNVEMGKEVS